MQKTPFIQLKNIGKIYVSDGNVAVGIRGVDASFERGEFVAVTGASGSGKSTLLNVISGMDTYEEGEMLVEGDPTSHYVQKDWETYRENYISFIFQDYNIIESFTVLQNVELALLHIEDPRARRERAMELIRRVGLESHIRHKGSKLSGGQKQRTVIARALAKDSPVILADEPTGNLDSQSSREIIELLREVSADKLVIVVTHNFDEVAHCATRHIRVFDGAVELDHTVKSPAPVAPAAEKQVPVLLPDGGAHKTRRTLREGIRLGRTRFCAMPKLATFLCCLMTLTSVVITLSTATSYSATGLFSKQLMFTHIEGRTVVARQDGNVMSEAEFEKLAADIGASDAMHYDFMLDRTVSVMFTRGDMTAAHEFSFAYPANSLTLDAGRYPVSDNELILDVPISVKPYLGGDDFEETELPLLFDMATYRVVGVRYYYDNTCTPRMLFTEDGYKIASAVAFFSEQADNFRYTVSAGEETDIIKSTFVDFSLPVNSYYLNLPMLHKQSKPVDKLTVSATLVGEFFGSMSENSYYDDMFYGDVYYEEVWTEDKNSVISGESAVSYAMTGKHFLHTLPQESRPTYEQRYHSTWQAPIGIEDTSFAVLSPDILMEFMYEHYYTEAYTQGSLFFGSDRMAHAKVEALRDMGYVAVVSDETVTPDVVTLILNRILLVIEAIGWGLTVFFASVVLTVCTSRAMNAIRGDIGIMRSMGIPTSVVKVSIYVQTLISLIPAMLITGAVCAVLYMLPATNAMFTFLHAGDYAVLAVALVAIAFVLSRKQAAKMFNESVKKTLRGGKKHE